VQNPHLYFGYFLLEKLGVWVAISGRGSISSKVIEDKIKMVIILGNITADLYREYIFFYNELATRDILSKMEQHLSVDAPR
jgi:hypothetical protein